MSHQAVLGLVSVAMLVGLAMQVWSDWRAGR